jgi:hypothetical protein
MDPNWEAIGAIGEIVGAAAVVGSLAYLAVQIRQNTKQVTEQINALKLDGHNAAANDHSRFRQSIIQSPQVASLWRRGKLSYVDLSPDEQAQVGELFRDYFWANANMQLRNLQSGAVDDSLWEIAIAGLRPYLENEGVRQWWGEAKSEFPSDFVAVVDRATMTIEIHQNSDSDDA